jgi:hypothetical protein
LTNGTAHQKKQLPESRNNPQDGRKVFSNYSTHKGLISKIYKELKKLNGKRTNNLINTQENDLKRQSTEEEIQKTNKYMKKCSTPLSIKEKPMKTSIRSYLSLVRMAIIKK